VAYQPGLILSRAQEGHILSGGLGILLMGLIAMAPLVGVALNGAGLFGISFISVAIVVLYLIGARLLAVFQRKRVAEVLEQEAVVLHYDRISRRRAYLIFGGAALVVVVTGVWLSTLADQISDETGLGRSFVGALLLGVSTSLPEIVASLTAVRIGAIDLAIGNVLGSNLFNVALLAVYDVFDGGANLWAVMSDANALGLIIAMMMTAVVIVSLIYRASPKTPFRVSWDGAALIVMYLGAMAALYILG
jgi:cation:H+ antiporter